MTCQLCESEKPLVNSHIIPRSFYEIGKIHPNESSKIISTKDGFHPKRSPTGIYDQIVCVDCERKFSPWDNYGYEFLTGIDAEKGSYLEGGNEFLVFPEFEYLNLKLFFLSLLWRSEVSRQVEFSRVRLGSHEPIIRSIIRSGSPGKPEDYPVLLSKFKCKADKVPVLTPHRARLEGLELYKLCLAGCVAFVKIDEKPFSESLSNLILKPDAPLIVDVWEYEGSKERQQFQKMAKMQLKPPSK